MIQFNNPDTLLTYLESKDPANITFNKIRIRKDSGLLSISTDSAELSISLEFNSDQGQFFTIQEIVDLIVSLDQNKVSTAF